jgi:hypothetical protein
MTENNQNVKAHILNRIDLFGKLEEAEKRYTRKYDPKIKKIKVYGVFAKETYDNIFLFHAGDVIKYLKGVTKNKKWFIKNFRQPVELIQINILVPFDNHTKPLTCNLLNMCGVLRAIYLCGRESKTDIKTKNGTELSNFMVKSIMMGTLTDSFNIYNYFNNNFDSILREYIYPDKTLDNLSIEMDSNDIEEEIKESNIPYLKIKNPDVPNLKVIEYKSIVSEKDLHKQFSALLFSAVGLILLMSL